jgi:AcrR family transcriptional regulator
VPTGVHIRDVRKHLFEAAERVLLNAGPDALTSRAVTTEADVAKGVLHRHFADFADFLAELVQDRIARLDAQAAGLRDRAGTGTVAGNLTDTLTELFDPVTTRIVSLVLFRHELRARLPQPQGLPLLADATAMIASYLREERELGRIAADADTGTLALALIGTGHLLAASETAGPAAPAVETIMADVLQRRLL